MGWSAASGVLTSTSTVKMPEDGCGRRRASRRSKGVASPGMGGPIHELPDSIELSREEYRLQHAALEASLDLLDRFPASDPQGEVREQVESALKGLLRRIWPFHLR